MQIISRILELFDDDYFILVYGFGDLVIKDQSVFCLCEDGFFCKGLDDVLIKYNDLVCCVILSGLIIFVLIIKELIEIVKK